MKAVLKKIFKVILKTIGCIVLLVLLFAGYVFWDNCRVVNTEYTYQSERVPEGFDGFKISVIADSHNGRNYEKIAKTVEKAGADIVCIVGDIISKETTDMTNTEELLKLLTSKTPVYYVFGNQEYYHATENFSDTPLTETVVEDCGGICLNNKGTTIERNGDIINLVGFKDSRFEDSNRKYYVQDVENFLGEMESKKDPNVFAVLLVHRPQYLDVYSQYGYDLIFAGHLHGGVVNIKYIRDRILMKKAGTAEYSKGRYDMNGTTMFLSTGTGMTHGCPRIFNTPEVMTVTLKSGSDEQ